MYARIYRWVRAGFTDYQLLANIIGGTRPYINNAKKMYARIYRWVRAGLQDCQLLANIVGGTRPYKPLTDIIVFDANAITNY